MKSKKIIASITAMSVIAMSGMSFAAINFTNTTVKDLKLGKGTAITAAGKTKIGKITAQTADAASNTTINATGLDSGDEYTVPTKEEIVNESAEGVDTTEIDAAITAAKAAKVAVSVDGSDVAEGNEWVTKAVNDALNEAITTAENAKKTVKTEAEVATVVEALNTAVSTYKDSKKDGTKEEVVATETGVEVTPEVTEGKDKDVTQAEVAATQAKVEFTVAGSVGKDGDIAVKIGDLEPVDVTVANSDTAELVAGKIAEASFTGYTVVASGAKVTFTATEAGKTTITGSTVDVKETGLTAIETITVTDGKDKVDEVSEPATQAVVKFTVTKGATNAGTLVVTIGDVTAEVEVAADADINAVATAIRGASITGYTAGGSDAVVTFTKDVAGLTESTTASVADKVQ